LLADLARRVAIRTTSQEPENFPVLCRYLVEEKASPLELTGAMDRDRVIAFGRNPIGNIEVEDESRIALNPRQDLARELRRAPEQEAGMPGPRLAQKNGNEAVERDKADSMACSHSCV
jgi:hypothetical protein